VELGHPPSQPTPLFEDNKSAIHIVCNNGKDKGRTNHMDYVHELAHTNQIHVLYRPTFTMIADILTKPIDLSQFLFLRAQILGNFV